VKTDLETLGPTRVKLTVAVPFDELQPSLSAAYRKISGQIRLRGFRPGKVPPALIDRHVGRGAVLEEAVNSAVPRLFADAVRAEDVDAIGHPELEVTSFGDGADLVFTAEVDVRPPIALPGYDSLEATVDAVEPTDAEVDEQVEALRSRFGTLRTVERAVQSGDFVTVDLSGEHEGERVDEASASGLSYEVGSGQLMAGLDEALVGASAGAPVEFDSTLADGRVARVSATVRSVRERQLPDLDDDFAQTASEFDTLAELREDIRARLRRVRELSQRLQARDRVLDALLSRIELPTPEHVFNDEMAARRRAVEEELEESGLTMEAFLESEGKTAEEWERQMETAAREAIKTQLVLDDIARREQLTVSQAELTEQVVRRAAEAQVPAGEYARLLVEQGQLPSVGGEILRAKAVALVLSRAKVTDTAGQPVDLSAFAGPGDAAAAGAEGAAAEGAAGAAGGGGPAAEGTGAAAVGAALSPAGEPGPSAPSSPTGLASPTSVPLPVAAPPPTGG
jgi:trigger factor